MFLRHYSGRVYRNFATSIESQDVTDDLVDDAADRKILQPLYYPDDERNISPVERVLRKSTNQIIQEEIDAKFRPSSWYPTRYSDGTWGVLYTAESEETALREALFHMVRFYKEELRQGSQSVQRRVLSIMADTDSCRDLASKPGLKMPSLVSKDEAGYPYCRTLALAAIKEGATMMRTPSARNPGSYCTPIFDKTAVAKDEGHLKYLRCVLKGDGNAEVTGIIEEETKTYRIE